MEDQEELAEYAREIEARRTGVYTMSDDERAAVGKGLAEADRGEFVSDELIAEADKRHEGRDRNSAHPAHVSKSMEERQVAGSTPGAQSRRHFAAGDIAGGTAGGPLAGGSL